MNYSFCVQSFTSEKLSMANFSLKDKYPGCRPVPKQHN